MKNIEQIKQRLKQIRHEQEHYFPQQPNEPTEVELCGYVEQLLTEQAKMLCEIYESHLPSFNGTYEECPCDYCMTYRETRGLAVAATNGKGQNND